MKKIFLIILFFLIFSIFYYQKKSPKFIEIKKEKENYYIAKIKINNKEQEALIYKNTIEKNLKKNDNIIIERTNNNLIINDIDRGEKIILIFFFLLFILFFVLKDKALRSFFSLILTFFIIFFSIIPNIINGYNPLISTLIGILFLIPINYFFAHGFSKKTFVAVISSLILIILSAFLSYFFIYWLKITGIDEEANFVNIITEKKINFELVYLSSIILGIFGSLDDITITQASIVETLKKEKIEKKLIYQKAIEIGQDHINSIFNTLIIVYLSASFPLYLLFYLSQKNFYQILNYEIIIQEILRMILSTIFIILAVPLTTYLAIKKEK
ncbi:MAG: YibE/F family protein [Patescibacteria group bacterium]|nr:YibE/F family protein [Patescibacteria group bacterium]